MATNSYTDRELLDFNYKPSDKVNSAEAQKTAAEQALNNYGPYNFNYGREAEYNKAIDAILNREKFSYDLNGDALYQQYKDNYINQGRMAMMDTMGQAAAMTGGYGNSYAATVGNQAYQASLQNLNNMIPELYQLALQSYNAEGDRLATNFNVLGTDREIARSEYETKYNADISRLTADRDYYSDNYNNERSFDYTNQHDTVQTNNDNYWNEFKAGYQAEQDAIAQANWEKQYALDERQVAAADKSAYYESIIADMEEKYAGYLSPEMQKAASSQKVKEFIGSLMTQHEYAQRQDNVTIDGEHKRFDNYTQYVDAMLESKYGTTLTENEVKYLKGLYGIDTE